MQDPICYLFLNRFDLRLMKDIVEHILMEYNLFVLLWCFCLIE